MSTTRSSRSTGTPSRARATATPGSAASTRCSPPSPPRASAPVVVAQRLRKGSCGSPRGAKRLVADALKTVGNLLPGHGTPLLRADSAFYGAATVGAAVRGGADVSVTVRLDPKVKKAIAAIDHDAWSTIEYTDAVFDEATSTWVSRAEVAEVPFTAFTSKKLTEQVTGRLVVRRIPDLNPNARHRAGHPVRHLALPRLLHHHRPRRPGHRGRGQDPPRPRDHRAGPRRPEELRPGPPALGKVHRQRRLAGPGRHRVQPHPRRGHDQRRRAGQGDHRHHPPQADRVPARVASSARRITLHLPTAWPWETAWTQLFSQGCGPPTPATA